jgi:hypothetical protein
MMLMTGGNEGIGKASSSTPSWTDTTPKAATREPKCLEAKSNELSLSEFRLQTQQLFWQQGNPNVCRPKATNENDKTFTQLSRP